MDEIGQTLRQAREEKGLSLEDVQAKTKINARFLNALETGDYDVLPTPVQARGFLRNYARALGLDPQPILDRYAASQANPATAAVMQARGEITPNNPLPIRQDQPFFDPVNMEVEAQSGMPGNGSSGLLQIAIIAALLLALFLVANRFFPLLMGSNDGRNAVEEIGSAVQDVVADVANFTPTPEPTAAPQGDSESGAVFGATPEGIISTGRNNPAAAPTVTPTRPPLPATMEEVRLNLDVIERAWLEVTVDGEVVYSGIAKANDVLEWVAQEEARLVTGNAIGIFATVNDVPLGRLGGRGEQYEETWRTTQQ